MSFQGTFQPELISWPVKLDRLELGKGVETATLSPGTILDFKDWLFRVVHQLTSFDCFVEWRCCRGAGVRPLNQFSPFFEKKSMIRLECKSMTPRQANTTLFRFATPSSPSQTLEELFELTRRPSRALDSRSSSSKSAGNFRTSTPMSLSSFGRYGHRYLCLRTRII